MRSPVVASALLFVGCGPLTLDDLAYRLDPDGDGVEFPWDCDDHDPTALRSEVVYADADADGYGRDGEVTEACGVPAGWAAEAGDCDDYEPTTSPGATEQCDGLDNDCDGEVDNGFPLERYYPDADGDGYGDSDADAYACTVPEGSVPGGGDCDDTDPNAFPGNRESCDGVDNDCDYRVDEDLTTRVYRDDDGDGFGQDFDYHDSCDAGEVGFAVVAGDCDDANPAAYPEASEDCDDGFDTNCDGYDDGDVLYVDADGDGDGDPTRPLLACEGAGVERNGDCDDTDSAVSSTTPENCYDGLDNDCDGYTDFSTYYRDRDGDGYGDPGSTAWLCYGPSAGYVDNALDCFDNSVYAPRWVAPTGSDAGTGSDTDPYATIGRALEDGGDCVYVAAGTYEESIEVGSSSVDVTGLDGAESTILDGGSPSCALATWPTGCAPVVSVVGSGVVSLTGLTLRGGSGYPVEEITSEGRDLTACGGGLYVDGATVTATGVVIEGSRLPVADSTNSSGTTLDLGSRGGGVCVVDGSLSLNRSRVVGNFAVEGGGIFAVGGPSLTLSEVEITGNEANYGGALYLDEGDHAIQRFRSWCNTASVAGGGIYVGAGFSNVDLAYADLVLDTSPVDGGAVYGGEGTVADVDSVVVVGDGTVALLSSEGLLRLQYSALALPSGTALGEGVIEGSGVTTSTSSPYSVSCDGDPDNDSFVLATDSPAVDGGNPADTDSDGSRADAGASGGTGGPW